MSSAIEDFRLPQDADDPDFRALVDVRNRVEAQVLGTPAINMTADELFPIFRDNPHRFRRHVVARVHGEIVGRGLIGWLTATGEPAASLTIDVLESHRRRGIGQAILDRLEAIAAEVGRRVLQTDLPHTVVEGGDRLASPTGFGDLAASDPGVRFLLRRGYALELVARISGVDVAAARSRVEDGLATATGAAAGYRLVTWVGDTPRERLDDMAVLKTRMSTDAPAGELEVVEDVWDADRVRTADGLQRESGRARLTSAAEHVPSGTLVGYTELTFRDGTTYAIQEDTLVLREHRGHRLGMLVKAANLLALADRVPDAYVTTFNAEDNRPMLDVNEALGFVAIGHEGSWQKRV